VLWWWSGAFILYPFVYPDYDFDKAFSLQIFQNVLKLTKAESLKAFADISDNGVIKKDSFIWFINYWLKNGIPDLN